MARYVKELVLNKPESFVKFIMEDFLAKNQYQVSAWKKTEEVYRAGGQMEGYKYLKWSYQNGMFHLEAWLPRLFGKEMDLTGAVAALQKSPYRKSLEELFEVLQQELPEGGTVPGQQVQPIPVKTVDNKGAATMSLVLGILSIPAAFVSPLIGILLACFGFGRARMGSGSSNAGLAQAGKILCIIGIVFCAVIWILAVVSLTMARL